MGGQDMLFFSRVLSCCCSLFHFLFFTRLLFSHLLPEAAREKRAWCRNTSKKIECKHAPLAHLMFNVQKQQKNLTINMVSCKQIDFVLVFTVKNDGH